MTARLGVLGHFAHVDALVSAARALHARGLEVGEVYSPVPVEEVVHVVRPGRSPVRFVTFAGGVAGLVAGLSLAVLTTSVWDLVVGGKPLYGIPPFMVPGFELTILFGALCTLVGLLVFSRLPTRRFPAPAWRPAFGVDRFGLWVRGPAARLEEARALLVEAGALEVEDVGGEAP